MRYPPSGLTAAEPDSHLDGMISCLPEVRGCNGAVALSPQEKMLMKRLTRVRALFGFLRQHRHELFDDSFHEQLEGMYRATGAGEEPHPPALLCMVVLLQGYVGASDAEAVELAVAGGPSMAIVLARRSSEGARGARPARLRGACPEGTPDKRRA